MSAGFDTGAKRYRIVFDGGSKGNPGIGYGSYRIQAEGSPWSEPYRLEFGDGVTNNEAEYRSLIAALDHLAEACPDPASIEVEALGDSKLVLSQLSGAWKVKAANLRKYHRAGQAAAGRFAAVTYTWHDRKRSVDLLGH